jgi:hypothetical protein
MASVDGVLSSIAVCSTFSPTGPRAYTLQQSGNILVTAWGRGGRQRGGGEHSFEGGLCGAERSPHGPRCQPRLLAQRPVGACAHVGPKSLRARPCGLRAALSAPAPGRGAPHLEVAALDGVPCGACSFHQPRLLHHGAARREHPLLRVARVAVAAMRRRVLARARALIAAKPHVGPPGRALGPSQLGFLPAGACSGRCRGRKWVLGSTNRSRAPPRASAYVLI